MPPPPTGFGLNQLADAAPTSGRRLHPPQPTASTFSRCSNPKSALLTPFPPKIHAATLCCRLQPPDPVGINSPAPLLPPAAACCRPSPPCKNRHLLETARTLLHHASLPPPFWLEATTTAAYLINRLTTKTLNMSSLYQKLYHQPPSYLHLKTFGCLCYPWTAYTCTNKLDPKSSPCIFIGYSSDHKGFRCFDPQTFKLIISRHVRFHEHESPMATHSITLTIPPISTIHNPLPPLTPTFSTPTPPPRSPHPAGHTTTPTPTHTTKTYIQYQRRHPLTTHPLPYLHYYPCPNHTPPSNPPPLTP